MVVIGSCWALTPNSFLAPVSFQLQLMNKQQQQQQQKPIQPFCFLAPENILWHMHMDRMNIIWERKKKEVI